jgi:hypothetical protein
MTARRVPGSVFVYDDGQLVGETLKINFVGTAVSSSLSGSGFVNVQVSSVAANFNDIIIDEDGKIVYVDDGEFVVRT